MMKTFVKRAIRDEKGAGVLALVLVLLVVGGLILTPLLGLMSTGLMAGQAYERHTDRLYAADAGVEDAIWKIQTNNLAFDPATNWSQPWHLTANGKNVTVQAYREDLDPNCPEDFTYRIFSTAEADGGGGTADIGSSTAIDAHLVVSYLSMSGLLDNAIVSNNTINIQPNNYIDGDVWLPDKGNPDDWNKGIINGDIKDSNNMTMYWPTYEQLSAYYLEDVEGAPDPGLSIDVQDTNTIGPCYREGSLTVDNAGDPATLILEGTVYVTGDLKFQESGTSHNYTVDLNKQTIFVEGTIDFPSNVVSVAGPGCIIAVGDIGFQPSIAGNDFVLVYSIEGTVNLQPSGNFTGCIAGVVDVNLQPGCTIQWTNPEGIGLNVPWGAGNLTKLPPVTGLRIESWEINPE